MRISVATCALLMLLALPHFAIAEDLKSIANGQLAGGEYDAAIKSYRRVIEKSPEDGQAHYGLASAYMAMGSADAAVRHFTLAGELGFQTLGVGYRLARIDAQQGRKASALDRLSEIAEAGFPAPALIENEEDFAGLRNEPQYQAALAQIQQNRYPCKDRFKSRQFDFWLGEWVVTSQGQPAGENHITSILGGCVLLENWTSVSGQTGQSFNYYDASRDHWRQIWVDDTGGVLEYTGQVVDGVMRYEGVTPDSSAGIDILNKMTFSPNEDGSVRQLMEQSRDRGETWQVVFDGHYVRQADRVASMAPDR